MNESELLNELTPVAESLLERHLATSKEWFPHDYVPYSRGRDHVRGHQWTPDDADLAGHEITPEVRSALLVNLQIPSDRLGRLWCPPLPGVRRQATSRFGHRLRQLTHEVVRGDVEGASGCRHEQCDYKSSTPDLKSSEHRRCRYDYR